MHRFVLAAALVLVLPQASNCRADSLQDAGVSRNTLTSCSALNQLKLADVLSITAEEVAAGQLQPPVGTMITGLPRFCRVRIVSRASPESNINTEIWIPETGWNGRFLGTGNGGGGGKIYFSALRAGLKRGFATANTDMGTSPNADKAVGFPDKWADFGYRATHQMTVLSKAVVSSYFGFPARYSYFWGNSTGGQQAMSEAERYPGDYNGIVAGAPPINRTHLHSEFLWNYQATHKVEGKSELPLETITQLDKAIVAACAGHDGGAPTDDFLTDPRACKFDPASMPSCDSTRTSGCLTAPQLAALKMIYAGPTNPNTGERIYAPIPFGSEASKLGLEFQEGTPTMKTLLYPFLWAFGSDFNPLTFDFNKDETTLDQKLAAVVNANDPDLTAFQRAGDKLIMFTGTADPIVPFPDEINYYERVVDFQKRHPPPRAPSDPLLATQDFFLYYLVPGMGHGGGGPGVNSIGQQIGAEDNDLLHAVELWVEHNSPPNEIPGVGWNDAIYSKGERLRRNVCPYPAFPTYVSGDPGKASSFKCEAHARGEVAVPAARYLR